MIGTDTIADPASTCRRFGAELALDPRSRRCCGRCQEDDRRPRRRPGDCGRIRSRIRRAGVRCSRPGARILLFAQTSDKERIEVSGADICVGERTIFGSYSASVDLQKESAGLVFSGELPVEELISHRLPLDQIVSGFDLARHPDEKSLKIIVQPQRWS